MHVAQTVTDQAFDEALERIETFLALHEEETDGAFMQQAVDVLCTGFGLPSHRREELLDRLGGILPPMFTEQAASCMVIGTLIGLMAADSAQLDAAPH
jgi:hypothetical protein